MQQSVQIFFQQVAKSNCQTPDEWHTNWIPGADGTLTITVTPRGSADIELLISTAGNRYSTILQYTVR